MARRGNPYNNTKIIDNKYLDIYIPVALPIDPFDETYVIEQKYDKRPDLFSYDRYGTSKYWWVFLKRNMNTMNDPINDFTAGKTIRVPSLKNLENLR